MSDQTRPPHPPQPQPQGQFVVPPPASAPQYGAPVGAKPADQRNILGILALMFAGLGFVFACIPGALIVGWILLPVGFILGIISLFLKDKVKWQGLTAVIVAVVGTIVGVVVFFAVVGAAVSDAFDESDVTIGESTSEVAGEDATQDEDPAAVVGTRENPAPLGAPIEGGDWTVVINSVQLAATDIVLAANSFNEAPDVGTEYIIINYTATYTGEDPDGEMPAFVGIEYVTAAGVTVDGLDKFVSGPDEIDTLSTLYSGASVTGNHSLQVPSPADGVIAVRPGMFGDKVFVAIK